MPPCGRMENSMKLPVALQLYTVRNELNTDFEGTLRRVKELGYDGVEFAGGLRDNDPVWVRDLLAELDLVPIAAHVPFKDLLENPTETLAPYKVLGCRYIVVPNVPDSWRIPANPAKDTIDALLQIAKDITAAGFIALYHNHDFEFARVPETGKYFLDQLFETISADLLQTELDTCWVGVAGENPAAYIKKYSGRAPIVHLKDYKKEGEGTDGMYELIGVETAKVAKKSPVELRPVGYGVQDFPAILAAAEAAGTTWVVVEQDRPREGCLPLDESKLSRAYLKTIGY